MAPAPLVGGGPFSRKIDPQALVDVLSSPRLLLSIGAIATAVVAFFVVGRLLRRSALTAQQREVFGPTIRLLVLVTLMVALAFIWRPKWQAVSLLLAASAVGLARAGRLIIRSLLAWWICIGRDRLRRGDHVDLGGICGELLATGLLNSTVAEATAVDLGERTGALLSVPNGLLLTRTLGRAGPTQLCIAEVTTRTALAPAALSRLRRAVALAAPARAEGALAAEQHPVVVVSASVADAVVVRAAFEVALGAVSGTRDAILTRYLDLSPSA